MNIAAPASNTIGRRIGYMGHDVPVELILAANALPEAVQGRVGEPTLQADRYLEPTFTPASRSIAEQWLNGELDELEAVIFSRSDDSAQRLYYYMCELQRREICGGPRPLIYDIAACDRASSLIHTVDSTRHLANELGALPELLEGAIERVQQRTDLLVTALNSTRAGQPARGSFVERRLRAAERDWSLQFDQSLQDPQDPMPAQRNATRLMMIGSTPGDERLHEAAERTGANIIGTLNAFTPHKIEPAADTANPFEQVARRCRAHPWRRMLQSPAAFCSRAIESKVAGVILWVLAEDTGLSWVYPRLERVLREHRIAVLPLTMQQWNVSAETIGAVVDFASKVSAPA